MVRVTGPRHTARAMHAAAVRERPKGRLTPTEARVLALMAEGWSNAAIADMLVVSPRTVETHVRSIYHKLDLMPHESVDRRVRAVLAWRAERATRARLQPAA